MVPMALLRISTSTGSDPVASSSVSSYLSQLTGNDAFHNRLLYAAAQRSTHEVLMSFVSHARSIPSSILVDLMETDAELPKPRMPPALPKQILRAVQPEASERTPEDDILDEIFGPVSTSTTQASQSSRVQAASDAPSPKRTKQSLQQVFEDPMFAQPYSAPSPIQLSYS